MSSPTSVELMISNASSRHTDRRHSTPLLLLAFGWLVTCTIVVPAFAQKVGVILPIDESQVLSEQIPLLKQHLISMSVGSSSHSLVSLVPCDAKDYSAEKRAVIGASGREVSLPKEWEVAGWSELAKGAAFGKSRPDANQRQALLQEHFAKPSPVLSHLYEEIPSDVIAMRVDRDVWRVGFDWDCDLRIADDETVLVEDSAHPGGPGWIRRKRELIAVVARGRYKTPPRNILPGDERASKIWTLGYRTMFLDGYQPGWKYKSKIPQQLLEFTAGESVCPIVMIDFSGGPAELARAVGAAKQAECDRLIVDLGKCRMRPTDATQLLAKLSLEHQLPMLVNRKTPASPDYLVIPQRSNLPDLLELAFPAKQESTPGFQRALKQFLQQVIAKDKAANEKPSAEISAEWDRFRQLFSEIGTERFAAVAGTSYVAVRVPDDAVDGEVVMTNTPFGIRLTGNNTLTLYDRNGKRITGADHANGVRHDRAPPMDTLLSRGGYLVANKQQRWHGAEHDLTQQGYRAAWTRSNSPIIDCSKTEPRTSTTIEIDSPQPLPATLRINEPMGLAKLKRHSSNQVPDEILSATKHLREARLGVRSWWYRGAPRRGSIRYRPLFQYVSKQPPVWDDQHLQYWTILDSGYLQPGSSMMGDLGWSTPQRAWFLVQAAVTTETKNNPPPEIVQSIGVDAHPWGQELNRISQQQREPILGQQLLAAQDAKVEKVDWISRYQTEAVRAFPKDIDILWAGLQIPTANRWSPMSAWIRVTSQHDQTQPRNWMWYYDNDPAQEDLQRQLTAGVSASELLKSTKQPDPESKSISNWRDYLLALDQPSLRKQHLDLIANVSQRVVMLTKEAAKFAPGALPSEPSGNIHYAWAVDASYRKARAIGYRELPDVIEKNPIRDPAKQKKEFQSALQQLGEMVSITDPRFVLPLIRWERRRGNSARAYELLQKNAYEGPAMKWFFKKERDLFTDFGIDPLSRLGHARWFQKQNGLPVSY